MKYIKILMIPLILFLQGMITSCSSFFYYPSRAIIFDPQKLGFEYKDIYFESPSAIGEEVSHRIKIPLASKVTLHGWLFPQKKNSEYKGLLVFFHGNAQNITSHFISLAWLVEHGYDVFIFDYRGYGASGGKPDQVGLYYDGIAALEYALKLTRQSSPIVVYAQSLGGIVAMRSLVDFPQQEKISLVVLESTFSSYQEVAFDKLKSSWITFLLSPLAFILISDKMASKPYLKQFNRPTLVIHGNADPVVPYKFGEEIYSLLGSNSGQNEHKWWWPVEGGAHSDFFWINNSKERAESNRKRFVDFLLRTKIN
ncbi:MAG: alpha/beta hydrolase [Oligoflexia bacterium]|nr:alpha/beta hydrolase [Oligoflexia bacterium]